MIKVIQQRILYLAKDILTRLHSDSETGTALLKIVETVPLKMGLSNEINPRIIITNLGIILPGAGLYRSILFEFCLLISMTKPLVPEKKVKRFNTKSKLDPSMSLGTPVSIKIHLSNLILKLLNYSLLFEPKSHYINRYKFFIL